MCVCQEEEATKVAAAAEVAAGGALLSRRCRLARRRGSLIAPLSHPCPQASPPYDLSGAYSSMLKLLRNRQRAVQGCQRTSNSFRLPPSCCVERSCRTDDRHSDTSRAIDHHAMQDLYSSPHSGKERRSRSVRRRKGKKSGERHGTHR